MSNSSSAVLAALPPVQTTATQGITDTLAEHERREAQLRQDMATVQSGPVPRVVIPFGQGRSATPAEPTGEPAEDVQTPPGAQVQVDTTPSATAAATQGADGWDGLLEAVAERTNVVNMENVATIEFRALEQLRAMSLRYIELIGRDQSVLDIRTGIVIGRTSFLSQVSGPVDLGGFPDIENMTEKSRADYKKRHAAREAYKDTFIPETVPVPAGKAFLDWKDLAGQWKRLAQRRVMLPTSAGRDAEFDRKTQTFNRFPFVWENRSIKPTTPFVLKRTTPRDPRIKPLFDHLMFIGSDDEEAVCYFIYYFAWLYQHPGDRIPWAPLLCTSEKRMGKSQLAHILSDVFGGRDSGLVSACMGTQFKRAIEKGFTESLDNCWLKFVNELPPIHSPEVIDALKSYIADSHGESEHKGQGAASIQRAIQFVLTTNNKDVIPEITQLGRFLVLGTDEQRRPDSYYAEFAKWAGDENNSGPGAQMLADVLWEIEFPPNWNPKAPPPATGYAQRMNEEALPDGALFVRRLVEKRVPPFDVDFGEANPAMVKQIATLAAAEKWAADLTRDRLGKWLSALGYKRLNKRASEDKNANKPRCWRAAEKWNRQPTAALIKHLEDGSRPFIEE